jgi:toxin ParE1/3/4
MALKVRLTPRAQRDIESIRNYLLQHNSRAAEKVRLAIIGAVDVLSKNPMMGPPSDEPGIRIKLVPPLPYRIYYRASSLSIEILHVRHTARREPDPSEVI